tara:strand:- start:136 stop:894 length:759 start_codon:yes stop_codon:yes gene_type:complete
MEVYNLIELTKEGTQLRIIAEIFETRVNENISKRDIEKIYSLTYSLQHIDFKSISTIKELISQAKYIPGDVQRQVRTFHENYKQYGLQRIDKSKNNKDLMYKWVPELKSLVGEPKPSISRNIFKTTYSRDEFKNIKNNKCEICEETKDRMAIDHWRAHSVYDIDSEEIAVLLCEQCNNIHKNRDASSIARAYYRRINIVKNWINKETQIRNNGFDPNPTDKLSQHINIKFITEYYESIGSTLDKNFWGNLLI